MDERFSVAARRVAEFPLAGRAGLVAGTRELIPHPSYRLVYEIFGETAWILALVHSARQWPPAERYDP
jgi:toxin ParE1/3/4